MPNRAPAVSNTAAVQFAPSQMKRLLDVVFQ